MLFQESLKDVLSLNDVQGCFKEVFRVFTESSKGVLKKFRGCLKEVSRKIQGNFKGVSRKFQGCFN